MRLGEPRHGSRSRGLAYVLMGLGLLIVASLARTWLEARRFQLEAVHALSRSSTDRSRSDHPVTGPRDSYDRGAPLGVLEIPRLGMSTVVVEGDDEAALAVGIGHLPDTPYPWHAGNSALAAHRDTFFRPLRTIRPGDEVRFQAPGRATLRYRVRDTSVVDAADVSVIGRTERSTLTLITCYPFDYLGAAPQRLVVRAERLEPARGD